MPLSRAAPLLVAAGMVALHLAALAVCAGVAVRADSPLLRIVAVLGAAGSALTAFVRIMLLVEELRRGAATRD